MRKERKRSTKFVILELSREVALHGLVLGVHVVPGHKPRGQVVGQRRVDVRCGLPSGVPPKENIHILRQEEEVDQISEVCGHRLLVCHPTHTHQGPNRGTFLRHFGRWPRPPQWAVLFFVRFSGNSGQVTCRKLKLGSFCPEVRSFLPLS